MQSKKIRIAHVIGPAVNGGTETFVMNYYKYIDHSKIEFDFFVENESRVINQAQISRYGNGKVVFIPSYKKPKQYISKLTQLFKNGNYDIVHSNMNSLSCLTLKAAKKAGIKIRIAHSHSTSNRGEFFRNVVKRILRFKSHKYPTHFCACSSDAGVWLFGKKTFDNNLLTIIPNAIDLDRFEFNSDERKKIREELGISHDTFVVGTVGRLVAQKNPLFSLNVFNEYLKKNPNSVLMFVGDGPLKEKIQQVASSYGILDKIVFAGSHRQTECFYFAMDAFLFPSLYEGLGISLIEAQASGLICIGSTEIPHVTRILSTTVFLPLVSSFKEWAENIPIERIYMRKQQTSLFVEKHFEIKEEAKKLEKYYCSIVK